MRDMAVKALNAMPPEPSEAISVGHTLTRPRHNSATCVTAHRLPGHNASATVSPDTKWGKDFDKDCYLQGNKDT
jgi:hypothetical protein